MYRHARHFSTRVQARNHRVVTVSIDCQGLTMHICGDSTHHVVASGHNGNRLVDGVDVSEMFGSIHKSQAGATPALLRPNDPT